MPASLSLAATGRQYGTPDTVARWERRPPAFLISAAALSDPPPQTDHYLAAVPE
jgi:hypothetical protein